MFSVLYCNFKPLIYNCDAVYLTKMRAPVCVCVVLTGLQCVRMGSGSQGAAVCSAVHSGQELKQFLVNSLNCGKRSFLKRGILS